MPTAPDERDLTVHTERRRIAQQMFLGVLVVGAGLLVGALTNPWWSFGVIVGGFLTIGLSEQVRSRRTREGTDERARELDRWAASFSFRVTCLVLIGTWIWMWTQHGYPAARPYTYLLEVAGASYGGAILFRRWRGY